MKNVHAVNFLEDPKHSLMKSQTLRQLCVDALIFIRAIFVWPWNDSARTKQKQPTNRNIRKWFFYRSLSNRQKRVPFGWFSISSWKKNSLKVIFRNLGATEPNLGISFLSYGLRPRFWPFFKVSGKSLCCYWSDKFDFIRIFLALIRKVWCKPKIQWGKFQCVHSSSSKLFWHVCQVSLICFAPSFSFLRTRLPLSNSIPGIFPQTQSCF